MLVLVLALSTGGLAYAVRELPSGTASAVRVGVGAAPTVADVTATGAEPVPLVRVLLPLLGIVACVVGLEVVG